jgi:phosphatidylglycerol:prolipoprotein diacylglycerol transferase
MNPVAIRILGLDIRWYGILIATGILLGMIIAKYSCRVKDVDYDTFLNAVLIALPAGIVGARLYYVLFEFSYYWSNPGDIFNIREGGLAIHGGIIFALLAAFIYLRHKKAGFLKTADAAAPSIILAQAIGRWGNFFNQEAHGGPVSYEFIKHFPKFIQQGMDIGGVYYHPTFLYESLWDLCVFAILMILIRKYKKNGFIFFTYIGLYSIGRFFIEGLRTDSLMLGPLRIAQLVSLTGFILWLGAIFFYYRKRR